MLQLLPAGVESGILLFRRMRFMNAQDLIDFIDRTPLYLPSPRISMPGAILPLLHGTGWPSVRNHDRRTTNKPQELPSPHARLRREDGAGPNELGAFIKAELAKYQEL